MSAKEVREALEKLADDGTLARHDRRDGAFTIQVRGPLDENLGQNAHVHWAVKAAATATARASWKAAADERLGLMRATGTLPLAVVKLTVTAYLCRKGPKTQKEEYLKSTGYRPRDEDNLMAAMKPAYDGIVSAGLVTDDSSQYVTHGTPEIVWVEAYEQELVSVLVEPLGG